MHYEKHEADHLGVSSSGLWETLAIPFRRPPAAIIKRVLQAALDLIFQEIVFFFTEASKASCASLLEYASPWWLDGYL